MWLARRLSDVPAVAEPRYRSAPNVATGYCNEATFLLNKKTGRYYRLDDVGTELWTLLRRSPSLSVREIVRQLSEVYEVAPEGIATDVATLIATLINYAVIEVDSARRE